jgi:hypothetical protein
MNAETRGSFRRTRRPEHRGHMIDVSFETRSCFAFIRVHPRCDFVFALQSSSTARRTAHRCRCCLRRVFVRVRPCEFAVNSLSGSSIVHDRPAQFVAQQLLFTADERGNARMAPMFAAPRSPGPHNEVTSETQSCFRVHSPASAVCFCFRTALEPTARRTLIVVVVV